MVLSSDFFYNLNLNKENIALQEKQGKVTF